MNRGTYGFIPSFLCLFAAFLSVYFLFAGCLTSAPSQNDPGKPPVTVDATLLDFGESLDSLSFNVTITDAGTEWRLVDGDLPSWCTATVEPRESGSLVTVRVDRAALASGAYKSSLTVKWGAGNQVVDIRMVVPKVKVDTSSLDFGESASVLNFRVTLSGGEKNLQIPDQTLPSWCTFTVALLSDGAKVTVRVNRASLSPGVYKSSITVKWSSGSHIIEVRMVVPEIVNNTGNIIIDTQLPE